MLVSCHWAGCPWLRTVILEGMRGANVKMTTSMAKKNTSPDTRWRNVRLVDDQFGLDIHTRKRPNASFTLAIVSSLLTKDKTATKWVCADLCVSPSLLLQSLINTHNKIKLHSITSFLVISWKYKEPLINDPDRGLTIIPILPFKQIM